jgi:hypothetical protein
MGRILIVLLLLAGVAAYLGARPAWRKIKAYRAHRFVAEAAEHFQHENWASGFERTRAALQLAPIDPDVLRHAARAYSRLGSEIAFRYFDPLLASPSATTQDREDFAALALRVGNLDLARQQIEDLLESGNPTPRSLVLGSQLAVARRDMPNALRMARDAASRDPSNPTNHFAVAQVLSLSKRPPDLQEAKDILWPHARSEGPLRTAAITAILAIRDASRSDREEIEKILAAKSPRSIEEELLLAEVRIRLDPSTRESTADAVIEKFGRGTPEHLITTARWLNRNTLFHRTRDLVLADAAGTESALLRLRYEALVGLGDLRGAYDLLMIDKPPGNPIEVEFLRCETALRLGNQAAVESHYQALLTLAQKDPRALRALADFATRHGNRTIANEVLGILARSPRDAATALRGLIRNTDASGETWSARDYARKLAALRPDDDSVKLQATYYDLLLKENLDAASASAQALHLARPEDYNRRAVLALAHLRRRENAKALALVSSQSSASNWFASPPGIRAVVAATFGAAGRIESATNMLNVLPIARLKPEERELIKPFITRALRPDSDEEPIDLR